MRRLSLLLTASSLLVPLGGAAAHARVEPLPSGTDVDYQLGGEDDGARATSASSRATGPRARCRASTTSATSTGSRPSPTQKRFWQQRHADLVLRQDGRPVVDENWGE